MLVARAEPDRGGAATREHAAPSGIHESVRRDTAVSDWCKDLAASVRAGNARRKLEEHTKPKPKPKRPRKPKPCPHCGKLP